jgi:hypothetical protein
VFLGGATVETHSTKHPDGRVTVTTVTREGDWDDDSREAAYSLYDDEQERCPDCGQTRTECARADVDYFPQKTVCWATAARRVAMRKWDAMNEGKKPDAAGYLPTDGATVWVSRHDLEPDHDFLNPSAKAVTE